MDDEGCFRNPSHRRRIEETLVQILKASDLETATELNVRAAAAERLGFELSGFVQRRFVQQLIESFLLSNAAAILRTTSSAKNCDGDNKVGLNGERYRKPHQQQVRSGGVGLQGTGCGKVVCKLSQKRWVTIHESFGMTLVTIRDFFAKDGNMLPSKAPNAGIDLTARQWSSFRNSFSSIDEAIAKLESQLGEHAAHQLNNQSSGSEAVAKLSEADLTNSVVDSATEISQAAAGISLLTDTFKRKRKESETDIIMAVADSATENIPIKAGTSDSTRAIRPHIEGEQTEADQSWSANALNSQEHILPERKHEEAGAALESQENASAERKQSEAPTSLSSPTFHSQGQLHGSANVVHPEQLTHAEIKETEADTSIAVPTFPTYVKLHPERLIPIQPARFDGKNYHSWRHQMEIFLNQLNIAYVLTEPRPSVHTNQEATVDEKGKVQRWIDDDYLCRHNILSSLCDSLFQLHSQKVQSARELWEELNFEYNEDFGTKRSQINKYIHFQMVDGISVLDQVHELHKIANSIMASGIWIDENFHISVIITKLPPSWKDFSVRLMREEFVPFNMLMHRLQVEEESRNRHKKNHKSGHVTEPRFDCRVGMRRENRRVCYSCGKEGHIIKYCPNRKFDGSERSNEKEHNVVLSPSTGDKIVEAAANTEQ